MKGILATICALALLGSATATFPNDLYYSHHPDLAVADSSNYGYSRGKNSLNEGPQSNSYQDAPTDYNERRPYRANYGGNEKKGSLIYNQDGSINWAETKSRKHKVAQTDDNGNLMFPLDGSADNKVQGQTTNVNNRISSTDTSNNNNNNQQDSNNYGNNQGNNNYGNNQGNSNYGNNQGNSNYGNNQGNNNYGNNQGNNNYGGSNNYGGNSQGNNNYGGNNQGNNNYGNQGNNQPNDNYRTTQNYNAYRDGGKSNAGFAGGMRLAGAEPEDGYFRGTGTFYDLETRTGSCGKQNKNTEMVAALNAEQMGDSNSSNEKCGKEIEVVGPNGKTITVTVVDSCKTCESGGLDLSPAAYEELGDFSHGSIPIKWKFI